MNLTEIRDAVEKKYIALPLSFEDEQGNQLELKMRNVLRLGDGEQKQVQELSKKLESAANEGDLSELRTTFGEYLEVLTGDKHGTKKFLKAIDGDMAIMVYIIEKYHEQTQTEKA